MKIKLGSLFGKPYRERKRVGSPTHFEDAAGNTVVASVYGPDTDVWWGKSPLNGETMVGPFGGFRLPSRASQEMTSTADEIAFEVEDHV